MGTQKQAESPYTGLAKAIKWTNIGEGVNDESKVGHSQLQVPLESAYSRPKRERALNDDFIEPNQAKIQNRLNQFQGIPFARSC